MINTVILILLCFGRAIPLSLHVIGFYLLYTKSAGINKSQKLFLLNLSMSEIMLCVISLVRTICEFMFGSSNTYTTNIYIIFYSFSVTYYMIMICLTLDRLAKFYFNMRYSMYWTPKKTKLLLGIVWLVAGTQDVLFYVYCSKGGLSTKNQISKAYVVYVYPTLDTMFLVIATTTYSYIFKKFSHSARVTTTSISCYNAQSDRRTSHGTSNVKVSNRTGATNKSKLPTRRRSTKLLLPSLLVLSFIVFVVLCDLVYFLMERNILSNSTTLYYLFGVTFYVGLAVDAIIYVIFATTVGRKILNRISACAR